MSTTDAGIQFTHAYFMQEARSFLVQMGNLSFWRLSEDQRENALKGLFYCYTHVVQSEEDAALSDDPATATDEMSRESHLRGTTMRMVTDDYTRRSTYALFHPKLRENTATPL